MLAELHVTVHRYGVVQCRGAKSAHNCDDFVDVWIDESDAPRDHDEYRCHYVVLFISVSFGLQEHHHELLSERIVRDWESDEN